MSLCNSCRAKADIITGDDPVKRLALGNYTNIVGHKVAHAEIMRIWLEKYGGQEKIDEFIEALA